VHSDTNVINESEPAGDAARQQLLSGIPVTDRRLDLAGVTTAILEGGNGPPVVLLHGPAGYAAHWIRVIPGLVATHHVVAPDLPDHGASQVVAGELTADRVMEWLDQLIESTCPIRPVLVGHLLGGAIAARFAAERGGRLDRLVLVNTFGLAPFEPAPEFGVVLQEYMSRPAEDTHDRFWRHCSFDLDRLQEQLGRRWAPLRAYNLDRVRAPSVQAAMGSLMAALGSSPIASAALAGIAVPTTLIWGRHDRATPVRVAQTASASYGWPLQVIDNAADDPAMDQPEAFLRALRASLGAPKEES
jgi:pimeloyl-ACP methyl ester carboxylesterase